MYPLTNLLSTTIQGPALLAVVIPVLKHQGWQVMQSFDLQTARQTHSDYACPHHGTAPCNCLLSVYLLYGGGSDPLTLVAQGRDGVTDISLVDDPDRKEDLQLAIQLRKVFGTLLSQLEPEDSAR